MSKFPWITVGITLLVVGGGIWAYSKYKSTSTTSTLLGRVYGRGIRVL
jgi:hypothetical protein